MTNKQLKTIILLILIIGVAAAFLLITRKFAEMPEDDLSELGSSFNMDWAKNKLWDDGLAEVAHYNAERIVYGKVRHYDYVYVTVKETFNREFNVKTDDYVRTDLFDVIKVNKFASIRTENYPYHYLSSLFLKKNDPVQLYKFTNSSQEWCGNTFKRFDLENERYIYHYDSYFDDEGRGSRTFPADVLFEDQLSYTLRTLKFIDGAAFTARIVETQISNRATKPVIYQAKIGITKAKPGEIKDDSPAWKVSVELKDGKTNVYWFKDSYPNILLKMIAWDGRKLELDHQSRYAYWEK